MNLSFGAGTNAIGIRMAIGAKPTDITRMVFRGVLGTSCAACWLEGYWRTGANALLLA